MPDTPLGRLVLESGLVSAGELRVAIDESEREERRLGDVLVARGLIPDHALARLVGDARGLPIADLPARPPPPETLALLGAESARRHGALPLGVDGGVPLIALGDPTREVAAALQDEIGLAPRLLVAPVARLAELIALAYGETDPAARPAAAAPARAASEPPGSPGASRGTQTAGESGGASLRARAAKGVLWTGIGNWGTQIAAFVVFMILSRLLEPDAFGLVALASVFVGFIQVIADQGLADAVVQRKRLDGAHLDTAFWAALAMGVVLAGIVVALAVPVSALLGEEDLAPVLVGLALAIPVGSSTLVQRAVLTRELAFRSLTIRTLVAIGVGSVVGIGAAFLGFGVWSLVAQNLANQVAGMVVLWSVTPWRPGLRFSRSHARELFGFGANVVGFRLVNYFNRRADDLLVGSYLGAVALGFYSVAYRMLILLISVTSNLIDFVAFPLYARLQSDRDRLRRAYYKSTSFVALTSFPIFVGIVVMAPDIVPVLFGSKWSESVPVMQVLALFGMMQAINYLNGTMIKALGKPSWRLVIVAITAVLNVTAFFIAVRHGIVAVAVALVLVGYLVMPLSYWAVNRLVPIGFRAYVTHVRDPLLASLLLGAVLVGLRYATAGTGPLVTLAVATSVGVLVYWGTIRVIARPLADEVWALAREAVPALGVRRRRHS